ncbi:MAG: rod shape-determining protein MreD [Candidatus Nealsonbacteria bacterium]|nr:rod shape-determining protein MreD [Candidatus Nealsonbacteria bacterium]
MKKILIPIVIFYFLVLAQTSFLVHFSILGVVPNISLILAVFWNFIEKTKNYFGLYNAFLVGFFLDVFSQRFFGFYILGLLAMAIFLKFIIRKYVQIPFVEKN